MEKTSEEFEDMSEEKPCTSPFEFFFGGNSVVIEQFFNIFFLTIAATDHGPRSASGIRTSRALVGARMYEYQRITTIINVKEYFSNTFYRIRIYTRMYFTKYSEMITFRN